jgi:tape measure domain-containing protein
MASVTIKDFIISLGFESNQVTKGLDTVKSQVKGFSDAFIGAGNAQKASSKQLLASTEAVTNSKKKQLALDKQSAKVGTLKKGQATMLGPNFKDIKKLKKAENGRVAGQKAMYNRHSEADNMELKRKKAITNELEKASKIKLDKAMQFGPSRKDISRIKTSYKQRVAAQKAMHNLQSQGERMDAAKTQAANKPALDAAKQRSMAADAVDRDAKKFRGQEEADAGKEANTRQRAELDLTKKLSAAKIKVQRRIDEINRKYGETNKLVRQRVMEEGAGSKRADATVASVQKLKDEYSKLLIQIKETSTVKGLGKVNQDLVRTANNTTKTTRELDKLNRKLTAGKFAAKGLSDSLKNLGRSYVSIFAIGAGGVAMGRLGQDLIASQAALLGASGSAEQAAKDFEFLQDSSQHLGVGLKESAAGYAKVGAAARSAGLGVEKARNTFLAAQEVSTAFNLTADDTSGIFRAFSQILSKGKLSTEELLQLGERVPIAFQSAADAMGMSTQDMLKQIETGKIQSVNFLPDFADELRKFVNESGMLDAALKTSRSAMGRFKNSFENNVLAAFDSGTEVGMADFFNHLNEALKDSGPMFRSLGAVMGGALSLIGLGIRSLTQVFRPLFIAVEGLIDVFNETTLSVDKTTRQLGWLKRLLYLFAAVVLLPVSALEQLSVALEDADNWVKILGGTLGGALGLGIMFKYLKALAKITGALWLLKKVSSKVGGLGGMLGGAGATGIKKSVGKMSGSKSAEAASSRADRYNNNTKFEINKAKVKDYIRPAMKSVGMQVAKAVTLGAALITSPLFLGAAAVTAAGVGVAYYAGAFDSAKPTNNTTNSGNKTEVKNTFNINGGVPADVESAITKALQNTYKTSMSTGG